MRNVTLILDDGSRFHGKSFGYEKPASPAGSTIAGIRKLESMSFRSAAMEAVIAAWERDREMQQQK